MDTSLCFEVLAGRKDETFPGQEVKRTKKKKESGTRWQFIALRAFVVIMGAGPIESHLVSRR